MGNYLATLFAHIRVLFSRWNIDPIVLLIISSAIALDIVYRSYTTIDDRNYDGPEHLRYIQFLAEHWRLPPINFCVACGHPPLYYAMGATLAKVLSVFHLHRLETGLQFLSLAFFVGFLGFAAGTIRLFVKSPLAYRLSVAMVAFWPSSVLNSVRLHNDSLASLCMVGALVFAVRSDQKDRPRDLCWAAVWAALSILTKSSGYTIAAVIVIVAISKAIRAFKRWHWPSTITLAILTFSAYAASHLRTPSGSYSLCERVLGRACNISSEHFGGNRLVNYLYFDARFFVVEPFVANDPSDLRRDFFWNAVAKSSLFGTMPLGPPFANRFDAALGILFSVLLLALVAYVAISVIDVTVKQARPYSVLLLAIATMVAMLAAFRVAVPTPMHEDFRHVFPLLVPFVVLFGKSLERHRSNSRILFWVGAILALAFIAATIALFRPRPTAAEYWSTNSSGKLQASLDGKTNSMSPKGLSSS